MILSHFQDIGQRPYQEDRFKIIQNFAAKSNLVLVIVCDGHGGQKAADFLLKRFPEVLVGFLTSCPNSTNYTTLMGQALEQCVSEWDKHCFEDQYNSIIGVVERHKYFQSRDVKRWTKEELESGATLCAALFDSSSRKLFVLNLGDSRACWYIGDKLIGSTVDHCVPNIMKPVKNFPFVYGNGRIEDDLGMCRAFGDNTEKLYGVISHQPDLLTVKIGNMPARLIVATDGFFDYVTNHNALYNEAVDAADLAKNIETFDDNITVVYMKIPMGLGQKTDNEYEPLKCAVVPPKKAVVERNKSPVRKTAKNVSLESQKKKSSEPQKKKSSEPKKKEPKKKQKKVSSEQKKKVSSEQKKKVSSDKRSDKEELKKKTKKVEAIKKKAQPKKKSQHDDDEEETPKGPSIKKNQPTKKSPKKSTQTKKELKKPPKKSIKREKTEKELTELFSKIDIREKASSKSKKTKTSDQKNSQPKTTKKTSQSKKTKTSQTKTNFQKLMKNLEK